MAKKQKAKPPTPPESSSEPEDGEGEEEGLLTDDFPPEEGEDSTSPTQESELFEAESAVPRREVGAPDRSDAEEASTEPSRSTAETSKEVDR